MVDFLFGLCHAIEIVTEVLMQLLENNFKKSSSEKKGADNQGVRLFKTNELRVCSICNHEFTRDPED
jgi:hypothetical protein